MGLEGLEEVENQRQNERDSFAFGFQMSPGDMMLCLCATHTHTLCVWFSLRFEVGVFVRLKFCLFCRIVITWQQQKEKEKSVRS